MKFYHFFALATVCALSLAGCSDNDMPSPADETEREPSDLKILRNQLEGQESVMYKLDSFTFYKMSYANNDGWIEQDFSRWCGVSVPTYGSFYLHEGRTWKPVTMDYPDGRPSALSMPFYAYRCMTGFDKSFYVSTPMEFDAENSTLEIGKYNYKVESVTNKKLKLTYISEYAGGIEGKGGKNKFNLTFKRQELSVAARNKMLFFESDLEAKLAMLEMIRARFGDEFNVNDYLGGRITLSYPMVNLNDIEAGLKAGTLY